MELAIYELNNDRIIATATDEGRALASQVLGGNHADADAATDTGFAVADDMIDAAHLARHGWSPVVDRATCSVCGCDMDAGGAPICRGCDPSEMSGEPGTHLVYVPWEGEAESAHCYKATAESRIAANDWHADEARALLGFCGDHRYPVQIGEMIVDEAHKRDIYPVRLLD